MLAGIGIALSGIILSAVRNIEISIGGEPEKAAKIARQIASGDPAMTVAKTPPREKKVIAAPAGGLAIAGGNWGKF